MQDARRFTYFLKVAARLRIAGKNKGILDDIVEILGNKKTKVNAIARPNGWAC